MENVVTKNEKNYFVYLVTIIGAVWSNQSGKSIDRTWSTCSPFVAPDVHVPTCIPYYVPDGGAVQLI